MIRWKVLVLLSACDVGSVVCACPSFWLLTNCWLLCICLVHPVVISRRVDGSLLWGLICWFFSPHFQLFLSHSQRKFSALYVDIKQYFTHKYNINKCLQRFSELVQAVTLTSFQSQMETQYSNKTDCILLTLQRTTIVFAVWVNTSQYLCLSAQGISWRDNTSDWWDSSRARTWLWASPSHRSLTGSQHHTYHQMVLYHFQWMSH